MNGPLFWKLPSYGQRSVSVKFLAHILRLPPAVSPLDDFTAPSANVRNHNPQYPAIDRKKRQASEEQAWEEGAFA